MSNRKSISKKTRFEIFKRDLFVCQYCGSSPPSTVLELDHIHPISKGGDNHEDNLLTSCFDCNRGKAANLLTEAPDTLAKKTAAQKEKQEQLKEFEKLISRKKALVTRRVNALEKEFISHTGHHFSDSFKESARIFFEKIVKDDVHGALELAVHKMNEPESIMRYFCGICWRMINTKTRLYPREDDQ